MSFRVKLRIKQWKVKLPVPNPIIGVDSGTPITDFMLRFGPAPVSPPPGINWISWNGGVQ